MATVPPQERYSIEKQIGKGAYGTAYVCKDKTDGRKCVLKKVRLARQSHKERQSSLQELLILSNVHHRNVLKYVTAWVENGCSSCMVVELCPCGDLFSQLRSRHAGMDYFHEVHLQEMLVQLASGLDFLHKNCIAHRDFKSGNIFITEDGCLKIADFGLADILDRPNATSTLMVGTPNYMSPELVKEKPYGVKNDIWALGCVMYEVSALKPAFNAFNMEGLIKKITTAPTPQLPAHYSDEWKEVVRAMLSKEEEQRPSAAQILALPWLQSAIKRVEMRHGPAFPKGDDGIPCCEYVEIKELPEPIAKLAAQFKQAEIDAELKAAQDRAHHKEMVAKYAPKALRPRLEEERREAEAEAEAVRQRLEKMAGGPLPAPAPRRASCPGGPIPGVPSVSAQRAGPGAGAGPGQRGEGVVRAWEGRGTPGKAGAGAVVGAGAGPSLPPVPKGRQLPSASAPRRNALPRISDTGAGDASAAPDRTQPQAPPGSARPTPPPSGRRPTSIPTTGGRTSRVSDTGAPRLAARPPSGAGVASSGAPLQPTGIPGRRKPAVSSPGHCLSSVPSPPSTIEAPEPLLSVLQPGGGGGLWGDGLEAVGLGAGGGGFTYERSLLTASLDDRHSASTSDAAARRSTLTALDVSASAPGLSGLGGGPGGPGAGQGARGVASISEGATEDALHLDDLPTPQLLPPRGVYGRSPSLLLDPLPSSALPAGAGMPLSSAHTISKSSLYSDLPAGPGVPEASSPPDTAPRRMSAKSNTSSHHSLTSGLEPQPHPPSMSPTTPSPRPGPVLLPSSDPRPLYPSTSIRSTNTPPGVQGQHLGLGGAPLNIRMSSSFDNPSPKGGSPELRHQGGGGIGWGAGGGAGVGGGGAALRVSGPGYGTGEVSEPQLAHVPRKKRITISGEEAS